MCDNTTLTEPWSYGQKEHSSPSPSLSYTHREVLKVKQNPILRNENPILRKALRRSPTELIPNVLFYA